MLGWARETHVDGRGWTIGDALHTETMAGLVISNSEHKRGDTGWGNWGCYYFISWDGGVGMR